MNNKTPSRKHAAVSLFGLLADVVLAPVRVATVVTSRTVRAAGKVVTLDPEGVLKEAEKAVGESAKVVAKIGEDE